MRNDIAQLQSTIAALAQQVAELKASTDLRKLTFASAINDGDTAWMLISTAMVLFMTIPGLALFYGGLARANNILAIVMHCFTITCLITVLWLTVGYSLSFGPADAVCDNCDVYGDASRFWLQGMTLESAHSLAPTIPETVYCTYQLTFAIISPALITGAFAERMHYPAMILFMTLWHLVVYCPIAHSVWHPDGFLFKAGALDFAGGNVIHILSGISGLVCALYLGRRNGYPTNKREFEPHNILFTAVGGAMLWFGWFGFNAGSAGAANHRAGYAMLNTQIAAATSGLSWTVAEWMIKRKPSVLGMVSGTVSGLVAITPACGYVDVTGAFIIGLLGGPVCYFGAQIKHKLLFDDALDAFGVHAVGGILGGIATGFFAHAEIDGIADGVFYASTEVGGNQLAKQLYAIAISIGWAGIATFLILIVVNAITPVRVSEEHEGKGLDSYFVEHAPQLKASGKEDPNRDAAFHSFEVEGKPAGANTNI